MTAVRVGGRTLGLSNLDKALYPDGWTKGEVIDYYARVADTMLPHLRDRALTRLRFPGGVPAGTKALDTGGTTPLAAGSFYEKNAPVGTPPWVRRQPVRTSEGVIDYVVADETATLVWLANLAALELHVPQWTIGSGRVGPDGVLDLPGEEPFDGEPLADRVVVDLDPGAGMDVLRTPRCWWPRCWPATAWCPCRRPPAARASRCTRPSRRAAPATPGRT
jgi:bifunctional non-homologous end joining protein LigD